MNTLFSRKVIRQAGAGLVPGLALVALLSSCGGGDDGGAPAASAAPAQAAVPDSPNPSIVASLPGSPSHPPGSEELAAFNLLNAERGRCGFGLLADNVPLNAAARAHADYLIINGVSSHLEDQTRYPEGFTGTDPAARVKAQGYLDAGGVADEFALFSTSGPVLPKQGLGELGVRGLLNAPYHLNGLMSGYRDVGLAVRTNADTGKGARVAVVQINAAYQASAGPQQLGSSDVQTYPCQGTTGVNRQLTNESPNPVPGRDLRASPLGTSIYIAVREGNRLTIGSAAMTLASTGQAVSLRPAVTGANDPYGPCASGCFRPHQAYVVPDAPLQADTAYSVTITGTNNGQAFSRSFTFTTGS